jgi:hypothetical protein
MHTKVAHFLNCNAHFYTMPFLWALVTSNKIDQMWQLAIDD